MSRQLTDMAQQAFDKSVKHEYSMGALLRPHVRVKTGVKGESLRFNVLGKGMAGEKFSQEIIVPMNLKYKKPIAYLTNWVAAELTDIFDDVEVPFSEQAEVGEVIGKALGRRSDQMVLDQLGGATYATNHSVGSGSTAMSSALLRKAKTQLMRKAVPQGSYITCVLPALWFDVLADDEKFVHGDYEGSGTRTGRLPGIYGMKMVFLEDRSDLEGWDDAGGYGYCFDKKALGLAEAIGFTTEVKWELLVTSWVAAGMYKAGSTIIDPDGIVRIQSSTTTL